MRREIGIIEQAGLVTAVEQAADGVVITDTEGNIQYVNPAFTAMTGYTSEEAVGQNPRILKSGRHSAALYEDLWNTIRSGRVWHGEMINRRKDGTFYNEEMRITPVEDSNGEIVSYIAIKHDVTVLRAAEEAQRFLAAIVESSENSILTFSPTGIILTWNRGAEAVFGYPAGDVIGKHVSMLVAPERLPGLAHITEQVLQGKAISQYEGLCRRKNGRRFHVSLWASPIKNSAGDVTAISVIVHDVSERHEAEQALALLASIVESSNDAILGVDLDGSIVSWNHGAEALFGYSSREIIGKHAAILAPPGRGDEVLQGLDSIKKGLTINSFETVLHGKDGRGVDVALSVSPLRNAAGEVVGASGIAHGIGKRLLTERKLRKSEKLYHEVFEQAPFGMCVTGLDGRFTQANAAFCQMLGYSEQELRGTPWTELTHPDDLEASLRRWEQAWRAHSGQESEKRYLHRSGKVVWTRIRTVVVHGDGGDPPCLVIHVEDITERKLAEQKLRENTERFRGVFEHAPVGICVIGLDDRLIQVNAAFCEMLGYSEEELLESSWKELTHPDDRKATLQRRKREPGVCLEAEKRYLHRTGKVVWTRIRTMLVQGSDGGPILFCSTCGGHHRAQAGEGGAAGE